MFVLVFSLDFLCHFTWNGMENPSFYHSPRKKYVLHCSHLRKMYYLCSRELTNFANICMLTNKNYHSINDSKRAYYKCD